jgi:hypothetical protein
MTLPKSASHDEWLEGRAGLERGNRQDLES